MLFKQKRRIFQVAGLVVALAYAIVSLQLFFRANHHVWFVQQQQQEAAAAAEKTTPALLSFDSTTTTTSGSTVTTNHNLSVVPQDSLLWSTDVLNNTQLFSLFSTGTVAPIIVNHHHHPQSALPPNRHRPVRVRVLLLEHKNRRIGFRDDPQTWAISDEVLNICMDGFERSPYFELLEATIVPDFTLQPDFSLPETDYTVWVVDMRRMMINSAYSIGRQLVHLVNQTHQHNDDPDDGGSHRRRRHPQIQIVFMDFRDRIYAKKQCTKAVKELIEILGKENVRIVLQQVVRGRYFDKELNFPTTGNVWDSRRDVHCLGGLPILHMPYVVRSDYAQAVMDLYPSFLLGGSKVDDENQTPSDTVRPVDIAHFWKLKGQPEKSHAVLRNKVTELLLGLEKKKGWNVTADFVSVAAKIGRSEVSSGYLEALLTTKIIVVAQRDRWVDHYRLFEAIIGGALVMTDPMWGLPEGLVDKKSIIVYQSLDHLQELLEYYLEPSHVDERLSIAREGWKVAVTRHRTVHWMERLFFGRQLTL